MACVKKIVCENTVYNIAISSDSRILAMAIGRSGVQLCTCSGEPLERLDEERYSALSIAFSPASSPLLLLAIGSSDEYVRVWDCINRVRVAKLQSRSSETAYGTTFSPNGCLLAVASNDGIVQLWRTDDWDAPPTVLATGDNWPFHVSFSCDSRLLASSAGSGRINLWPFLDNTVISAACVSVETMLQDGTECSPSCLAFSPVDNRLLACGGRMGCLVLVSVNDDCVFTIEHKLQGHTKTVQYVSFSPCGKHMASISYETTVRLWSVASGICLRVLQAYANIFHVVFFPNGRQVAASVLDNTMRIWTVNPWRDFTHHLSGASLKTAIFNLMCVRARLEEKQEQVLAQQLQVLAPRLPIEIWLLVFEQLALVQKE